MRRNWQRYRKGFYGFDTARLARTRPAQLLGRPDTIRNPAKVEVIVRSAAEFLKIQQEHGSVSAFLDSLRGLRKAELLKLLQARFAHVGPYTAEFYLHCVGHR